MGAEPDYSDEIAREIDIFRPTLERFVRGQPDALLLVEFSGTQLPADGVSELQVVASISADADAE